MLDLPDGDEPDVLPIRPPALSRSQLVALVDCVGAAQDTLLSSRVTYRKITRRFAMRCPRVEPR